MKKIFGLLFILSVIIFSCKKDTQAPAVPVITYSAWSSCTNGVQTRTYTVSGGTATAPADSLTRACDYSSISTGSWKVTADSVYVAQVNQTFDILNDTAFYQVCEIDDVYTFNANNTYNLADAGTVCSPDGSTSGTWAISANKFIWDGDTQNPFPIVFFSSSKMILNYSSTLTQGGVTYNYTLKTTYTKL